MKKLFILLVCLLCAGLCRAEESRLIINPGRETFVHFPSEIMGDKYTLTVFLPEKFVPLSKRYPVVYLFGPGPKQAEAGHALATKEQVLAVAVNFKEEDYKEADKIVRFLARELVPYIDTNYLTLATPSRRVLAVQGEQAARVAKELFYKPELFGALALFSPKSEAGNWETLPDNARVFVAGEQSELAVAQASLERANKTYGRDFALAYGAGETDWFGALPLGYLLTAPEKAALKRLQAALSAKELVPGNAVALRVKARLKGGFVFDYVPPAVRFSPPYLVWNAGLGSLESVPGAESGSIKIRGGVDKITFSTKITLKKQ